MSKYICKNCNHDFKQKSNYNDHLFKKKNPCQPPINNLQNPAILNNNLQNPAILTNNLQNCTFCLKSYSDKYCLTRHHTTCKKKKESEQKIDEMQILKNKIAELENKMNNPQIINNITNNNITTNNNIANTNNIVTNIANFGKLDNKKIGNNIFFNTLLNNSGLNTMLKLIEYIHKNDKLKEYQNVEITDLGRNLGRTCTNNKWEIQDANEITDKVFDEGFEYYEIKFDELVEEIDDKLPKDQLKIKRNKRFIFIMKGNVMFNMNDDGDYIDDDGVKISENDFKNGKEFEKKLKKKIKMLLKKDK